MFRTIFDQLRIHYRFSPAKPAIMLPESFVTYGMLETGINSVQKVIADLAPDRDHPVGVLVDNPARHLIIVLALMRSGFAFASVRREQVAQLPEIDVQLLLTDLTIPSTPNLRTAVVDVKWFSQTPAADLGETPFATGQVARVIFTSGSTGRPKAIAHTLKALHARMLDYYLAGSVSESRTLCMLGISAAGLAPSLRALASGNTIVFAPYDQALQTMSTFGVTELRATTVQMRGFAEQQRQAGLHLDIRVLGPGGSQLSVELARELQEIFKARIINFYTSTEAGDMALAAGEILKLRAQRGNCFVPVAQIEIVDENCAPVSTGREGRIRVRSHALGWTFHGNIIQTNEVKGDGWFYPGDVGRLDGDGLLIVTGRVDELLNAGGVKFSPEVMEDQLKRFSVFREVAVIRMSGDSGTPEPWLAYVADRAVTAQDIESWLARNVTGELGSVTFAKVVRVDAIPRSENAKIARRELRAQLGAMTR